MQAIGCDFLSATGRKFLRGPRGTGFLYVRRERLDEVDPPSIDLHAARWTARDEYDCGRTRAGSRPGRRTSPPSSAWGRPPSTRARGGSTRSGRACASWPRALRTELAGIPGVALRDLGPEPCGIVDVHQGGRRARELVLALRREGINVWFSDTASTRLDMERRGLESVVRVSVHYYNDLAEIERFCVRLRRS